jgi:hypothetical protein
MEYVGPRYRMVFERSPIPRGGLRAKCTIRRAENTNYASVRKVQLTKLAADGQTNDTSNGPPIFLRIAAMSLGIGVVYELPRF